MLSWGYTQQPIHLFILTLILQVPNFADNGIFPQPQIPNSTSNNLNPHRISSLKNRMLSIASCTLLSCRSILSTGAQTLARSTQPSNWSAQTDNQYTKQCLNPTSPTKCRISLSHSAPPQIFKLQLPTSLHLISPRQDHATDPCNEA